MRALHRHFIPASLVLLFSAAAAPLASAAVAMHGWLGVTLNQTEGQPLSIEDVFEGGPADKAGVKAGDAVMSWNGAKVANLDDLRAFLEKTKAGDEGLLGLKRGDKSFTVRIKLGDRDEAMREIGEEIVVEGEMEATEEVRAEQLEHSEHGEHQEGAAEVRPMHVAGGAFLGVRLEQGEDGVAITSTVEGSPAERMGLTAGEVIRKIDGKKVSTADEVVAAVKAKKPGDRIEVHTEKVEDGEPSERTYVFSLGKSPAAPGQAGSGARGGVGPVPPSQPESSHPGPSLPRTPRGVIVEGPRAGGAPNPHMQQEITQLRAEISRLHDEMAEMKALLKDISARLKR